MIDILRILILVPTLLILIVFLLRLGYGLEGPSSTGKVSSEQDSDGYYFTDAKDKRLKEVSGNCVIQYK